MPAAIKADAWRYEAIHRRIHSMQWWIRFFIAIMMLHTSCLLLETIDMTGFICYTIHDTIENVISLVLVARCNGLFFRSKRRNIRAWEYALFEGKNDCLALPNIALYKKLTEVQIENDCRIILESAQIIARTEDPKVSRSRRKLIRERYKHLMTLKAFADRSQRTLIREAEQAYRKI